MSIIEKARAKQQQKNLETSVKEAQYSLEKESIKEPIYASPKHELPLDKIGLAAVSYTHLTLPTICSV